MICPYCSYSYFVGYDYDNDEFVEGGDGPFYKLPIKMEQSVRLDVDERDVYGCPACNKLFMDY